MNVDVVVEARYHYVTNYCPTTRSTFVNFHDRCFRGAQLLVVSFVTVSISGTIVFFDGIGNDFREDGTMFSYRFRVEGTSCRVYTRFRYFLRRLHAT